MRRYELALVLTAEAGKEPTQAKKVVSQLVSKAKGKIIKTTVIGLRPLVYRIKKADQGWYGVFTLKLEPTAVDELDKLIKTESAVLRHLIIKEE